MRRAACRAIRGASDALAVAHRGLAQGSGILAGYGFPRPTAGRVTIEDLLPNSRSPRGSLRVCRPPRRSPICRRSRPGRRSPICRAARGPYQETMRAGLSDELSNHYAARLSEANLAEVSHIGPGQDWRDLPREMLPGGMHRALRKDHTRRYRRMTWDGIPRAVITRSGTRSQANTPTPSRSGRSRSARRYACRAFPTASFSTGTGAASTTRWGTPSRRSSPEAIADRDPALPRRQFRRAPERSVPPSPGDLPWYKWGAGSRIAGTVRIKRL